MKRGIYAGCVILLLCGFAQRVAADAVVTATVESGDPCAAGGTFVVLLNLSGNTVGEVGSYAFGVRYDSGRARFVAATAGALGAPPDTSTNEPGLLILSAFNGASTMMNGPLTRLTFESLLPGPLTLTLEDFGPTPLITTFPAGLAPIDHTFDTSGVTDLCAGITPSPTDTPQPATPTPTEPLPSPSPTATATQGVLRGDFNDDRIVNHEDLLILLENWHRTAP